MRYLLAGALLLSACGAPPTEVAQVEKVKARRTLEEAEEFHAETLRAIDEAEAAVREAERVVAEQQAAARRERLRAARSATTARSAPRPAVEASGDLLDRLAACESGMRPDAHSSSGAYHGAFQFSLSTWHGMGMSGDPHTYSYAEQKSVVARIPVSSWGRQFPHCARRLGVAR